MIYIKIYKSLTQSNDGIERRVHLILMDDGKCEEERSSTSSQEADTHLNESMNIIYHMQSNAPTADAHQHNEVHRTHRLRMNNPIHPKNEGFESFHSYSIQSRYATHKSFVNE